MSHKNVAKLTSVGDVLVVFATEVDNLIGGGLGEKVAMTKARRRLCG